MRFGLALALILCVIGILYIAPAIRQAAHQLRGDVQPRANDHKSNLVHAEGH